MPRAQDGLCSAGLEPGILLPASRAEAYNVSMVKKSSPAIEVTCPCCQSKLTVDTDLAVVLAHTPPPRVAPDVAIEDAARILSDQARQREDKFRDSWEAE